MDDILQTAEQREVLCGQSVERGSAVTSTERVVVRNVCTAGRIGERRARPQGWRRGSTLDPHKVLIVGMIEEQKDITLDEMVSRLDAEANVRIDRSA